MRRKVRAPYALGPGHPDLRLGRPRPRDRAAEGRERRVTHERTRSMTNKTLQDARLEFELQLAKHLGNDEFVRTFQPDLHKAASDLLDARIATDPKPFVPYPGPDAPMPEALAKISPPVPVAIREPECGP